MLEQHQIQRLLDIAFVGCQQGRSGLARQVIEGLDLLLEDSLELEICRAMSFYTVNDFGRAREILDAAAEKFAHDPMCITHLALVDILEGETAQARERLDGVIAQNKDAEAVQLATSLVAEYF